MAFLNSPIITYTQILVHRWGTRTRISVLFQRWTKVNVALQGLVPAVDPGGGGGGGGGGGRGGGGGGYPPPPPPPPHLILGSRLGPKVQKKNIFF